MTHSPYREQLVLRLREREQLTYDAISRLLFCSPERVRQIYVRGVRRRDEAVSAKGTIAELPTRAFNCLRNAGLRPDATATDVRALLPQLRRGVRPSRSELAVKNFGKKSLCDIEQWLQTHASNEADQVEGLGLA